MDGFLDVSAMIHGELLINFLVVEKMYYFRIKIQIHQICIIGQEMGNNTCMLMIIQLELEEVILRGDLHSTFLKTLTVALQYKQKCFKTISYHVIQISNVANLKCGHYVIDT